MDSEVLILMGLLVLVSAAYVRLWRRHRHDKGNLRLLFDAVENADYTLRFTEGRATNRWSAKGTLRWCSMPPTPD